MSGSMSSSELEATAVLSGRRRDLVFDFLGPSVVHSDGVAIRDLKSRKNNGVSGLRSAEGGGKGRGRTPMQSLSRRGERLMAGSRSIISSWRGVIILRRVRLPFCGVRRAEATGRTSARRRMRRVAGIILGVGGEGKGEGGKVGKIAG